MHTQHMNKEHVDKKRQKTFFESDICGCFRFHLLTPIELLISFQNQDSQIINKTFNKRSIFTQNILMKN